MRQTRATFQKPEHQRLITLIQQARTSAHISSRALSIKLGKQATYIARVERGERFLEVVEFLDICRAIGSDPVAMVAKIVAEDNDAT